MTTGEAINVLMNGSWYDELNPDISDADADPLHEAIDKAVSALRAQQEANDPLTLDELRGMVGEPVYIFYGEGIGVYDVFCGFSADDVAQFYKLALPASIYGKTWLAYRRKPEEGTV